MLHGGERRLLAARAAPARQVSPRIRLPSLPGHGDSDKPRADYTPEFYGRFLADFLDAIEVDRVTLALPRWAGSPACASRWRSLVASARSCSSTRAAWDAPSTPFSRCCLSPASGTSPVPGRGLSRGPPAAARAQRAAVCEAVARRGSGSPTSGRLARTPGFLDAFPDDEPAPRRPPRAARRGGGAARALEHADAGRLGRTGRRRARQSRARRRPPPSRGELVVIPDAGHAPQLERPHAFLAAVEPFLRKRRFGGPAK